MAPAIRKRRVSFGLVSAVAAGVLLVAAAGAATAQTFTMKLAGATVNDPIHRYLELFKERIEARTDGRIKGEVYPSAQLGGIPRLIEGVQLGTVELYSGPPGFLRGVDPRKEVADAPGLFDEMEHAQRTLTDPRFREPFLDLTTERGLMGVSIYMYGPSSYASLTPIRRLEDFRGKKFRVLATRMETELMSRLGATGVPMDFAEVLTALQQRILDGARSNIVVMGGMKFFTVTRFITDVQDSMIPVTAYVSTAWLNRLPQELREAVVTVGRELDEAAFRNAVEFDNRAQQLWRDNGAEVITLPDEDQAELMRLARTLGDDVYGQNPRLKEMYELLKTVAEERRRRAG